MGCSAIYEEEEEEEGGIWKRSKSVPVGAPVGQDEPPVPIGSQTKPSEPTRDKNNITYRALKRAVCAGLGKDRGVVVRVWWADNRVVWEGSSVPGS
jgi:hypothetical protein